MGSREFPRLKNQVKGTCALKPYHLGLWTLETYTSQSWSSWFRGLENHMEFRHKSF